MSLNVVITGANRGIGLCLAQIYLDAGCEVHALCRSASKELKNTAVKIYEGVDVSDADSLKILKTQFDNIQVDVLINNAGILRREALGDLDFDTVTEQLAVNAIAPLRIVEAFLPQLSKGAKIGLITSRMGSIEDNGSGGYYGYRMSKAALNAAGKSLALDLKDKGIAVAILHPGFVQTEMTGFNGDISPQLAALRLKERMDELTLNTTGTFWHSNGEELPW